jgi:hypothetical protein
MKIIHAAFHSTLHLGILFSLILTFGVIRPVHAVSPSKQLPQSPGISLETVSVDIWPEYDRPAVLVIVHVKISAQVSLPATMSIRIPASAGKPYAVAWQSPDKALYELNYDPRPAGDWMEIEVKAPSSDIQIEYYDPSLKKTGTRRDFTFHWSEKYPVQNLSLQIQQPANAANMTFRPEVGSGRTGDFGLTYYSLLVGKVNAGTAFDLAMTYDKPDDTLTNPQQFQQAQPNQPVDSGSVGRVTFDQFLPWGIGGLGLLLIAAGSFWFWRTGRASNARDSASRPRHSPNPAKMEPPVSTATASGEASFCHQCGKKAAPGDAFCRACGTKLK